MPCTRTEPFKQRCGSVFLVQSPNAPQKETIAVKVCSRAEQLGSSACHTPGHPLNQSSDLAVRALPQKNWLSLLSAAAKKREMDDNSKKIGQLLWRLNAGEVSEGVVPKLMQLCMAIDAADWHAANHIQVCGTGDMAVVQVVIESLKINNI